MTRFDYFLSTEDFRPAELLAQAAATSSVMTAERHPPGEAYVNQIGRAQEGCFGSCAGEVLPRLRDGVGR